MRANAAVFEKLFTPLSVTEVEIDAPRPGEALVRIVASGVCHTDALARDGDMPFPAPGVLGHEGAGVVAAVGDGVTGVSVGDKVVIGWPWCGSCRNCLEGQPRYCLELGPLVIAGSRGDGSTSLRRLDGSPLHSHFFGQSSFATHSICAASALVRVPDDADVAILGPLACGLSTGAGAVLNVLRPFAGSAVVVYGAGAVGLSAIMAARLTAATHIIAVDRLASRLSLATELGATEVIDVSVDADPVAAVHEICGGPADFAMDCAGNVSVLRQAADSVGMRGTVALIGGAPAGASFSLDHMSTLWGKRVIGILGGEGRSASLINTLITLNAQGRFPYDRLIEKFPLDQVNEALEASHRGDVIKPVLTMANLHSIAALTSCSRRSEPSSVREVPVTEPAAYQRSAAAADGFHHHHCGLGDRDPSALQVPAELRDQAIAAELHRLENAQADLLLDHCGAVQPGDRLLDAGSGHGGTSLMANRRFGCAVDGVSISAAHVQFANDQAAARGVADQVRFHYRNMLDTGFPTGSCQVIWTNETTMYVGLPELYREFARLLRRGGRYVCVTGCADDVSGGRSTAVGRIARHYTCDIHPRAEYLKALAANGFVPVTVADLTRDTVPYWRLRSASDLATGIEDAFLTAYREGSFQYMLIVADYVGW